MPVSPARYTQIYKILYNHYNKKFLTYVTILIKLIKLVVVIVQWKGVVVIDNSLKIIYGRWVDSRPG